MNMLQCAIHPKEYSKISMCKSAKEMWDKLELLYEGTSQVRETKANMLVSDYELFIMKSDETIFEMFARFMVIINGIRALGKEYSNEDLVRKILRSLSPVWHTKATVIEGSKDLSKITLDELIGSLMTYELNLKRSEKHMLKTKPIALKASSSSKGKSKEIFESKKSESDDDNLALITRQFRAFLKSNKKNFVNKKNAMSRQTRPSWHHCQDTATKVSPSVTERREVTCRVPYRKVLRAKPALGHTPTHKLGPRKHPRQYK
ncbi:hypothetical protein Taro_015199 [Colocasia esculenta]|uniref:UBN2 domain-containing protein n=1 Tax=Colocasia esculenta TaxID=4460 RepID=A0A843UGV8_COLES|nr:hypothetical protein [Colocasia esculenta]